MGRPGPPYYGGPGRPMVTGLSKKPEIQDLGIGDWLRNVLYAIRC